MKKLMLVLMAVLMVGAAGTAMAATATSPFTVTATVLKACSITTPATNLAFGNYDPLGAGPYQTTGTVAFRCTRNTTYWTYIPGPWTVAGPSVETLNVNFYTDAGYSVLFANAKTGGGAVSANSAPQTITIYGDLPASQFVAEGAYSQAFTFTVEY